MSGAGSTGAVREQGPLRVALTGGVAAGKSAAALAFARRGVPVLDADLATRELVAPGQPALAEIAARFGPDIICADGGLDRAAMRRLVFAEEAQRRALERILHPRVEGWFKQRALECTAPYLILAIPLLAEVGRYPWLDVVVVVDCEPAEQRRRLLARDEVDAALADAMIAAQSPRETRLRLADYVLDNNGSPEALDEQVQRLHQTLLERSRM